jgi:serine/threonine-protein kinase
VLGWWAIAALNVLPGDRTPRLDANQLAVAPFDVFDEADSLWRYGMVDVLSRRLDGAGPLRTVAPTRVLRAWRGRADEQTARALARQTGAGIVVFGHFMRAGRESLRVSVSVLDVQRSPVTELEVRDEAARVDRVADSLTVRVLRVLGETRPIAAVARSTLGSQSLLALKAFLAGEQYYRRNEFLPARALYLQAINLDNTFALAYRRMRGVLRALEDEFDSTSLVYAQRAGALNHGLSPRDSLLILADSLLAADPRGAFYDVQALARSRRRLAALDSAASIYPDDPEVWLELGEARLHFGHRLGIRSDSALAAFVRSVQLDPSFALAYFHVVELLAGVGAVDSARHYALQYLRVNPNDARFRTVAEILTTDSQRRERAFQQALELPGDTLIGIAYILRRWHDSSDISLRLVRTLAQSSKPQHARHVEDARLWYRDFATYSGRIWALRNRERDVASMGADRVITLARIGVIDSVQARAAIDRASTRGPPQNLLSAVQWFGLTRDTLAMVAALKRLESIAARHTDDMRLRLVSSYAKDAARAYAELARHDTTQSLVTFLALPDSLCSWACWPDRQTAVDLLVRRGRFQEAARLLDRQVATASAHNIVEVVEALLRARVADGMGDAELARAQRAFVAAVWRDADEPLRTYAKEGAPSQQLGNRGPS